MLKKLFKGNNPSIFNSVLIDDISSSDAFFHGDFFNTLNSKRVFGADLDPDDPSCIPPIVDELFNYMLTRTKVTGIFRIPGDVLVVEKFVRKVEKNKSYDLIKDVGSQFNAGSILKVYFREIPEPLIPKEIFTKNIRDELAKRKLSKQSREKIRNELEKLPVTSVVLIRKLCKFLFQMNEFNDKTKMDLSNLAIVFSPNIIKSENDEMMKKFNQFAYVQEFSWVGPGFEEILRNFEYYLQRKSPDDSSGSVGYTSLSKEQPKFSMERNPKTQVGKQYYALQEEEKANNPPKRRTMKRKLTTFNKNYRESDDVKKRPLPKPRNLRPRTQAFFQGAEGEEMRRKMFGDFRKTKKKASTTPKNADPAPSKKQQKKRLPRPPAQRPRSMAFGHAPLPLSKTIPNRNTRGMGGFDALGNVRPSPLRNNSRSRPPRTTPPKRSHSTFGRKPQPFSAKSRTMSGSGGASPPSDGSRRSNFLKNRPPAPRGRGGRKRPMIPRKGARPMTAAFSTSSKGIMDLRKRIAMGGSKEY